MQSVLSFVAQPGGAEYDQGFNLGQLVHVAVEMGDVSPLSTGTTGLAASK